MIQWTVKTRFSLSISVPCSSGNDPALISSLINSSCFIKNQYVDYMKSPRKFPHDRAAVVSPTVSVALDYKWHWWGTFLRPVPRSTRTGRRKIARSSGPGRFPAVSLAAVEIYCSPCGRARVPISHYTSRVWLWSPLWLVSIVRRVTCSRQLPSPLPRRPSFPQSTGESYTFPARTGDLPHYLSIT